MKSFFFRIFIFRPTILPYLILILIYLSFSQSFLTYQFRMDGHCFLTALLCALICFDTFISKPMISNALSLPQSSSSSSSAAAEASESSSLKHDPSTSIGVDFKEHSEKSTSKGNNIRTNNNSAGNIANLNSIPVTKSKHMCKWSELMCPNGICIPLSKYCNGIPDCSDKSDEPSDCSGE